MDVHLFVTPTGRVSIDQGASTEDTAGIEDSLAKKLRRAFESSSAAGLFSLATLESSGASLSASATFWQDFARRYLTSLCHAPETTGSNVLPVAPPGSDVFDQLLLGVPPMRGAEFLTTDMLTGIWQQFDEWIRQQIAELNEGLSGFLSQRAPLWHQVGRVCFHLAENSQDKDHPFAFLATYSAGLSARSQVRYQPLSKALQEYAGSRQKEALVRLLTPVHRASQQSTLVRELVDSGDIFHPLAWTPREAHTFLTEVPLYESSGIVVRLPDWWRKRPRPQVQVTIGEKRQSRFAIDALFDFNVHVALGDEKLSLKEWQTLMQSEDGLVWLKGRWVEVDREKLAAALDHWKGVEAAAQRGELGFVEGMRLLAGAPADLSGDASFDQDRQWSFVTAGRWLGEILAEIRHPEHSADAFADKELCATLRPYQQTGVAWLWQLTQLGLGACLADDMGLGKTIQVIALLLLWKKKKKGKTPKPGGPALLVLPASLLANWKSELERFAPSLRVLFVHPSEMDKDELKRLASTANERLKGVDAVLTTYGMLHRYEWMRKAQWRLVVLDEAQAIKNPASRQTRQAKQLSAHARVALTGTPVENRLSDLWSLFDFLCPGLLGSTAKFKKFVKTLNTRETDRYTPLRNLVSPYILRRLKTDKSIISDLPDKTELHAFCNLSKRQAAMYARSVSEMAAAMKGLQGIKRRGLVLAFLLRFKQICNHPSQATGDGDFKPADSGKFDRLAAICEEIATRQEKVLVFTQFREMTAPLQEFLANVFGRPGLVLHGSTAVGRRKKLVDRFQTDDGPPFFVLSLKAGGTGLNLTAASHVVHFDRWWNPAVENQATDRAFRIGQHRNVLVHKFVCRGTIEERIDDLIEDKKALAEDLLEGGAERLLTEMSDQELLELVALDVDKAVA